MRVMQHIRHIWPTVKDIADDLGIPYTTAHSWGVRGRIPADYDLDLIEAARKRGKRLTLEELAEARRAAVTQSADHPPAHGNATPAGQEGAR